VGVLQPAPRARHLERGERARLEAAPVWRRDRAGGAGRLVARAGPGGGERMRNDVASLTLCLAALGAACGSRGLHAVLGSRATALESGKARQDELALPDESSRAYVVKVPEGAVSLRVKLLCQDTDLALRARAGHPVAGGG